MLHQDAAWDLEVEWKDGSISWLPLTALKETKSVEVAQCAISNHIDTEPAFDWWVQSFPIPLKHVRKMNRQAFPNHPKNRFSALSDKQVITHETETASYQESSQSPPRFGFLNCNGLQFSAVGLADFIQSSNEFQVDCLGVAETHMDTTKLHVRNSFLGAATSHNGYSNVH